MRILIAEDSLVSRRLLESLLAKWGHEVITTANGAEAWQVLQKEDAPRLAILDWMMPEMDGVQVCRKARMFGINPLYILLLTSRENSEDLISGLHAGADDYVTKPFDPSELNARINVGARVIRLQNELQQRVQELEEALSRVNHLQGLLPICMYCHSVRDDENYWHRVEAYISRHSSAQFTHGVCPPCYDKMVEKLDRRPAEGDSSPATY
jgi:sigma-B regulation protein RsbU (phosphoserine phosphatase)